MTTARRIITKAMQKVGILVKSEAPHADEANDALDSLNSLIQSWSNDAALVTSRAWETFTLTGGDAIYTMGSGADFNTSRPTHIITGYIRISSIDYPLTVVTDQAYNSITFKDLQGIPEFINYDNSFATDNLRLYPVPAGGYSMFLLTEKPLATVTSLDTDISLPPGWERALVYNLALELAPEYAQQPDASIVKIAQDALANIRLSNIRARPMDAYPQRMTVRNVYSGWRY